MDTEDTFLIEDFSQVLFSSQTVKNRVRELGTNITTHYKNNQVDEVTVICITNGAILFSADLLRAIKIHARLDSIRVSSYQNAAKPVTHPQILDKIRLDITNRHILLLDDILDTGKTLSKIISILQSQHPASIHTCILLERQTEREQNIVPDFVGFKIPDCFVVGYGLDFAERYRNVPYIGVLRPECQIAPTHP